MIITVHTNQNHFAKFNLFWTCCKFFQLNKEVLDRKRCNNTRKIPPRLLVYRVKNHQGHFPWVI